MSTTIQMFENIFNLPEIIAISGVGLLVLLVLIMALNGLWTQVIWPFIDRNESQATDWFTKVFSPKGIAYVGGGSQVYYAYWVNSSGDARRSSVLDDQKLFLTQAGAEAALEHAKTVEEGLTAKIVPHLDDFVMEKHIALIIFMTGATLFCLSLLPLKLFLISVGVIGSVFVARILRDAYKAISKLGGALKLHMEDTNAHTSKAKDIDTDIKIGLDRDY